MSKLRAIISIIKTKNYVVITDDINDGYVTPFVAQEFLEEIDKFKEHLRQIGRGIK